MRRTTLLALTMLLAPGAPALCQDTAGVRVQGDSVLVRFVDADLRGVVQAIGRFLDRPVVLPSVAAARVTLETPRPVARQDLAALLRGLLEAHNLELIRDSAYYRVQSRQTLAPPAPGAAGAAVQQELTVIRLRHARAGDVAATLSSLYGGASEFSGAVRPGTLSEELRRNVVPPYGQAAAGPQQPVPGQAAPAAPAAPASPTAPAAPRAATLEGSVTIVPDQVTNSLLIRATRRDAEILRQAVEELDLRPLQVLIEVIIVEARRDRQAAWGLDLSLPRQRVGTGNTTVEATQTGGGLGDFVLSVMKLGRGELDAVLRMGASRGDVHILSRPVLLAANNQEARILVGSQRPFVQVSRSLPTDVPTRDQVIQYRDVGTRLTVRPTISSEGYVTLEVVQEVSSATSETAFDAPVISTREAATQVLVRDGQTIVIGGLVDGQRDVTGGGIPLLSSIPLLGGLFGRQGRRTTETELFLFLTPRVLRDDAEVEDATRRLNPPEPRLVRPPEREPRQ